MLHFKIWLKYGIGRVFKLSQMASNPVWRQFTRYLSFDDSEYNCLICWAIIPETLRDFYVAKSKENSDRQLRFQSEIAKLRSEYETLKDLITSKIGEKLSQLLETLDKIKIVRQDYNGNVFIGNHCKINLKDYQKLCSVVSDEPEFHEHISERFCIYSELDGFISAKRFLTEDEIRTVKDLCTRLGQLLYIFRKKVSQEKCMN